MNENDKIISYMDIVRRNLKTAAAPKRKRLSLNWDKVSPAERARIRREITEREQARRQDAK